MARTELPLQANQPLAQANGSEFREALHRAVSGEVRFDRLSRALYSTDASVYQIVPLGVVIPRTEDDVAATLGGMIANNSSGTRSVVYGKTGDHVLGLRVLLSDGSIITVGRLDDAELEAKCAQPNREGECYRLLRRLGQEHAAEIERRYPR